MFFNQEVQQTLTRSCHVFCVVEVEAGCWTSLGLVRSWWVGAGFLAHIDTDTCTRFRLPGMHLACPSSCRTVHTRTHTQTHYTIVPFTHILMAYGGQWGSLLCLSEWEHAFRCLSVCFSVSACLHFIFMCVRNCIADSGFQLKLYAKCKLLHKQDLHLSCESKFCWQGRVWEGVGGYLMCNTYPVLLERNHPGRHFPEITSQE